MRLFLILFLLFTQTLTFAQPTKKKIIEVVTLFHQALVKKDLPMLAALAHDNLKYQHSNGWIETKSQQLENIQTRYLEYHQFSEQDIRVEYNKKNAKVFFNAKIDVTLNGDRHTYLLKVQERWIQQENRWLIIERQATR
ncbi:MAG: nuclear transport factor 2 family protein [Chitinophagaceae bacterium]